MNQPHELFVEFDGDFSTVEIDGTRYAPMTWRGLMRTLDTVYPSPTFDGTGPGADPGPAIIGHLRAINEIREALGDG